MPYVKYSIRRWSFIIIIAELISMTSCSSDTESDNVDKITKTLMSNKWTYRDVWAGTGDDDHAWVDEETTTLYFITENSGIVYWIQRDHDTDLGNSTTKDYYTFTYSVSGNTVFIEDEFSSSNLTFCGSYLVNDDFLYEAAPMNSSDYELIKSLGPVTGKCGDNLTYLYDKKNNAIQISGSGDMYDYTTKTQPWHDLTISSVIIESGVTSIGDNAFCSMNICEIDFPGTPTLERIGKQAFENSFITTINLPNTVKQIDDSAFGSCNYLKTAYISWETLEYIGSSVFGDCNKLKFGAIDFGEALKEISDYAFSSNSLGKVTFKEGLEKIGICSFLGGIANDSLNLPNSLKSIGLTAINGKFSKIKIGSGLIDIGERAFITSAPSGKIYVNKEEPPMARECIVAEAECWESNESSWTLYVPENCRAAYSKRSPWNKFKIYEEESSEGTGGNEDEPSEEVIDANKQDEIDAKDYRRGRVSGSFNGAGTAYSPYLISSAADLRLLSDECRNGNTFKGKYFKMTNDIVINRNVLNVNGELNNSNNFERWIPIGRYSKDYEYDFQGNFDGDGYTVSGIYINRPKLSHNGLFGSIEGTMKSYAVIKNLTVKDSYISCSSGALIAGSAGYTTIENCHSYGYITGEYVAGISTRGTVERSDNYATVTGSSTACGICSRGTVFDCINYGNITGDNVGGIAYDGSQINNCINRGDIISNNGAAGGIRSCMKSGTVKNCVNLGKVYSKGHAGALVGAITNSGIVQNNHYLSSKQSIAVGYKYGQYTISNNNACSESEMKSEDVLSKLNSKRESGRCKWISGSDGYPTLDRK